MLIFSFCNAEEEWFGFDASVAISDFFSPKINSVNIVKVYTVSSADRAGLKEDDLVIEIDGSVISEFAAKAVRKSVDKYYFYLLNTPIFNKHNTRYLNF